MRPGSRPRYRALDLALPLLKPGHSLKFALLPEGQDPDDLLKSDGAEAVKAVIAEARPLADMLWARETGAGAHRHARRARPVRDAAFSAHRARSAMRRCGNIMREDFRRRLAEHLAPAGRATAPVRTSGARSSRRPRSLVERQAEVRGHARCRMISRSPPSEALRGQPARRRAAACATRSGASGYLSSPPSTIPSFCMIFWTILPTAEFTSRELDSLRRRNHRYGRLAGGP